MKKFNKYSVTTIALAIMFMIGLVAPIGVLAATSPTLGTVGSYSVLGHTTVTNTGGTTMPGDLGISIGGAPVGFPPGSVGPPGTIRNAGDSLAAQNANTAAYGTLNTGSNAACTTIPVELAGQNLVAGTYCSGGVFQLTGPGTLTLVGTGVWIFQSLSTLITTGPSAAVVGGDPCNIWWQVPSSATIGTGTAFVGNILALTSIALQTGASLNGRALAQTGAVTLDTNTITGSACLSASSSSSSSSAVVPKLPNTGIGPGQKSSDSSNIVPAGIAIALFSLSYLARKKRLI